MRKHMTFCLVRWLCQAHHDRVARAQRNRNPVIGHQHTSQRRWIVAGKRHHLALGIERVALHEERTDRSQNGARRHRIAQSLFQIGRTSVQTQLRPALRANVQQVHSRTVRIIDGRNSAQKDGRQKTADQRYALGVLVAIRSGLVDLSDLRTSKSGVALGTGDLDHFIATANRLLHFDALFLRGAVHPDGRPGHREGRIIDLGVQEFVGVQRVEGFLTVRRPVEGAVLLGRSAERNDRAEIGALDDQSIEHNVDGLDPHDGLHPELGGVWCVVDTAGRSKFRQIGVELHLGVGDDLEFGIELDRFQLR